MGETTMTRRRRRWPVWFLFCGLTVVLLLVAVQLILVWLAREAFYQEIRKAREAGVCGPIAAIAPPPVPAEENAAPLLLQAARSVTIQQWTAPSFKSFSSWIPDPAEEDRAALAARPLLEASGATLDLVHQAARRRACPSFSQSVGMFWMIALLHMLRVEASTAIVRNDARAAYRDITEMLRISDFAQQEPSDLNEWQADVNYGSLPYNVLRRALQANLPDEANLAVLARVLDDIEPPGALARALLFWKEPPDVAMKKFRDGNLSQWRSNTQSSDVDVWLYQHAGWPSYRDWAEWIRLTRKAAALAQLPYYSARAGIAAIQKRESELPGWYLMAKHHYLAFLLEFQASEQARHEGARIAVALARFRVAHGTWPDSLDALVPEFLPSLPLDPFTGKSFVYRRAGRSARVYSLGSGQVDRGGGPVGQNDWRKNILFPLGDQEPFLGR